jgi:hypothetical protein
MKVTTITGAAIALVGLAACGATVTPAVRPSTSSPILGSTSSPSTSSTTPSATPVQTVPPAPPLALFSTSNGFEVVNEQGVALWGLTQTQMEVMVGQNPQLDKEPFQLATNNVSPVPAGPNVLVVGLPGAATPPPVVVVLSSAGKIIGRGSVSGRTPDYDLVVGSPNGTEWAWNVTLGTSKAGQSFGEVEIAGIGVPTHTIFRWTAPVGASEAVNHWTDAGIILERTGSNTTCTQYFSLNSAAFIINPVTGGLSNLFSGDEQFLAATTAVKVAGLYSNPDGVSINGVVSSESGPFVVVGASASVSPDGNHVLVNRENFLGQCGGNVPKDSVELVTVATQGHVDLPNIWEIGWLNNSEFLVVDAKGANWVYNLEGKLVQKLTPENWLYLGTISAPGSVTLK